MFCCLTTLFSGFLHWREVLVFLQVITMILPFSHSKECFCRFAAKLPCCQVFFAREKVLACLQLYHANSNCFSLK